MTFTTRGAALAWAALLLPALGCGAPDPAPGTASAEVAPTFSPRGAIEREELEAIRAFLSDRVEAARRRHLVPSMAIGLYDRDGALWADGFGTADDEGSSATRATVYRVGSVSKLFTDIAVMQRVERGELDLDAPITDVLPGFRPQNPFGTEISLRQLMCHRAGLVREPPVGNYFDDDGTTLEETVRSLNDTRLVHEPGTVTKYSNAGIAVVGYVLEELAGVPFDRAVREAVLEPLGMDSSDFALSARVAGRVAIAQMRTLDRRRFPAPSFQLGMSPAGSLYTTIDDLAAFARALLRGETLLPPERLEEMFTPQFAAPGAATGYGLGFAVGRLEADGEELRVLGHGGAIYGFSTQLALLPDEGLAVAVTSSLDVSNGLIGVLAGEALEALLLAKRRDAGQGDELERFLASRSREVPRELAAEQVERLAGTYRSGKETLRLLPRARHDGQPSLLLDDGRSVRELGWARRDGRDWLVTDDVDGRGGRLEVVRRQADAVELRSDERSYQRVLAELPPAAPRRLVPLLGEYGEEHNPLFLFERGGELWALVEWLEQTRLREVGTDTFAIDTGMYVGEQLTVARGAEGAVESVRLGPVIFPRRDAGMASTETFRIEPVRPIEELREAALSAEPPSEQGELRASDLVELTRLDPSIRLDVRYASTNNFLSTPVYDEARAFLQRPAAEALVRASRRLRERGYGLLVHDAYRPWYVSKMFWDATPEDKKIFVADPSQGSRHNRGCAVDLTLYDLETGEPVQMVGGYDEMTDRSFPDYLGGTQRQRFLRQLLRDAMESEGFTVYEFEWWHFDHADWQSYGLQNLTFDEL